MRMLGNSAPPPAANVQTMPPAAPALGPTMPPHTAHTPAFGIIEATPRQAFDPAQENESEDGLDASEGPITGHTLAGVAVASAPLAAATGATLPGPAAGLDELEHETPLSTRPTERKPNPASRAWLPFWLLIWLADPRKRMYAGAGAALVVLLLLFWVAAPSTTEAPSLPPTVAAEKPADKTLTVSLKLRGVPEGAQVTIDGEATGDVIELPRGQAEHAVAVEAIGKQPWHMTYVPQTDSVVDVTMLDAPPPPPEPQPPAATRVKRASAPANAKPKSKAPVLRVPDF
jgi:hypothetical protein